MRGDIETGHLRATGDAVGIRCIDQRSICKRERYYGSKRYTGIKPVIYNYWYVSIIIDLMETSYPRSGRYRCRWIYEHPVDAERQRDFTRGWIKPVVIAILKMVRAITASRMSKCWSMA